MKRYNKWKRGIVLTFAVLLASAAFGYLNRGSLAAWGFDTFVSGQVEKKLADSYKPLNDRPVSAPARVEAEAPFSMLLLGVDARGQERGRSDTIIYTVVRPSDGNVLMVSIPRDTYAEIAGQDKMDKITHAYAFGGAEMAVRSVERLLGAKVDHYASINFQGFAQVVDALGGIPLPITKEIVNKGAGHEKFTIPANQDSYNGTDALNFVRYREDAGGDMSRAQRNREFLDALLHKASSMEQWRKIPEIVNIIGDNFRTDLPPAMLTELAKKFLQTEHHIRSYSLAGEDRRMGAQRLWYFIADDNDLQAVRQTIDNWMNAAADPAQLTVPSDPRPAAKPQIPA